MSLELRNHNRRKVSISMAPLIDVVFILLLFFMVVSQFNRFQTISLDILPVAEIEVTEVPKILQVFIQANGDVLFNDEIVNDKAFDSQLVAWLKQARDKTVVVDSDESVQLDQIISIVDRLKLAGANQIDLGDSLLP